MKDYYKTLGVSEKASQDEIKKAFRKLSKEHHPDANKGDDVRFKEVSEAYDTLSNEKKRREYDMQKNGPKFSGFNSGFSGFNPGFGHESQEDVFEDILRKHGFDPRSFRRTHSHRPRDGSDITIHVKVSLEDAFNGKEINIPIRRKEGGRLVERRFRFNIKKGFIPGRPIIINNEGHFGDNGGKNGDIIIIPKLKEHNFFEYKNGNLTCEIEVFFTQAILGDKVFIKHVNEETTEVNIPPNSSNGDVFILKNRGYPMSENSYGDLYIKLKITMPKELNTEEKRLIEEYHKQSQEKRKEFNFSKT